MLKILPFEDKYQRDLEALSPEKAEVLRFHGDVLPGSALAVVETEGESGGTGGAAVKRGGSRSSGKTRLLGAGYLFAGQSYRARADYPDLPLYNVQMDFALDLSSDEAVPAAEMLIEGLIEGFEALQAQEPGRKLALTYWVRADAKETRAFLESFGFREAYRMYRMVRCLGEAAGSPAITEIDLRAPEAMKRYIEATAESYGIPDSEAEMRFRILRQGARVFTIEEKTFVTLRDLGDGAAETENVFTRKAYRGQGLSTALLEGAAEILQKEGFREARLNVYPRFAQKALRIYRRLGYRRAYTLLEMHKVIL